MATKLDCEILWYAKEDKKTLLLCTEKDTHLSPSPSFLNTFPSTSPSSISKIISSLINPSPSYTPSPADSPSPVPSPVITPSPVPSPVITPSPVIIIENSNSNENLRGNTNVSQNPILFNNTNQTSPSNIIINEPSNILGIAVIIGGIFLTMLLLFCLYKRKTTKNKIHSCPSLTNSSETKQDTLKKSIPTTKPLKKHRNGKPNDYIIEHLDKSSPPEIKPPKLKRTKKFRLKTNDNIDNLDKSSTPKTNRQIPRPPEEKTNNGS